MEIENIPMRVTMAPWTQRNAPPTAVIWFAPRDNRVRDESKNIWDASIDDVAFDSPMMALVIARLRKGLSTAFKFPNIRAAATAFILISNAASETGA